MHILIRKKRFLTALALLTAFCAGAQTTNYTGSINGAYKVVFRLDTQKDRVDGFYYYEKTGIDIDVAGKKTDGQISLWELGPDKDTVALITGSIEPGGIKGRWKDLKTGKSLPLILRETKSAVTRLPGNLAGTYRTGSAECDMTLSIALEKGSYTYTLKTANHRFAGNVAFSRNTGSGECYIRLQGITWSDYEGQLDADGMPVAGDPAKPSGVEGLLDDDGEILIQNSGNAMNSYLKLPDCGLKYIHLGRR